MTAADIDRAVFRLFLARRCVVAPGLETSAAALYAAYVAFCSEQGKPVQPMRWVGTEVLATFRRRRPRMAGNRPVMYVGVGLRLPERVAAA